MTTVLNPTRPARPETTPVTEPAPRIAIADPAALGLGAFALTTFVLSLANSGLIPTAGAAVIGLAVFYGGIAQFAAGMWEFIKGNTFGATAFTSYGAFWLAFWWLLTHPETEAAAGAAGIGAFLLAWTLFTVYMTIAAARTNVMLLSLFIAATLTFLGLTIGAFSGSAAIHQLAGWIGIATALIAWYGSAAVAVNSTWKRAVFPLGPLA
ncbi:acetate uptake transporter [Cryobacterium psychrophilum]|uniref:Uncharacterized protein n=1 Tax=Cryobacterium psychrophilum TaxID=41988 RepID=A0A4Y8KSK3_9MICO|nr:acetate uptake transporter family protein [Cryobacterium psychrophilum]TDW29737.1 hypothetical protein EDD25_1447 [Cryobacterium psychrophilum]TFD81841.1 hypothetical protein E3T53_02305 [Cryobacterium psychrophilum]